MPKTINGHRLSVLSLVLDFGIAKMNCCYLFKFNELGTRGIKIIDDKCFYVFYQDLSEARYSGHVEHYESVTETRSFSKVAPPPPERSFSQSRGHHHDLHTRERALASAEREGSISRELSAEKESRSGHPDCDK